MVRDRLEKVAKTRAFVAVAFALLISNSQTVGMTSLAPGESSGREIT
jgi:hypothetical protein